MSADAATTTAAPARILDPQAAEPEPIGPGPFVAVVGASGVGKDALITYARDRLGDRVHFPRRVITRAIGGGEDHDPLDEDGFADACANGAFAVCWRAHGLGYGIPASADEHVGDGRAVVANVSRAVLETLAARYRRLVVVRIVVSDEVRELRLRTRKREDAHDISARLARSDPAPDFPLDAEISNDGTIAEGGAQLVAVIADAMRFTA